MTVKIKFLSPISKEKFLHQLANAKKLDSGYKHYQHKILEEAKDKFSFRIFDEKETLVNCEIDFYPNDVVNIDFQDCNNLEKLRNLLVFGLLDSICEKAIIRFAGSRYFYNGGEFFIRHFPGKNVYKIASNRDTLLEVTNSRQIAEVLTEIKALDSI